MSTGPMPVLLQQRRGPHVGIEADWWLPRMASHMERTRWLGGKLALLGPVAYSPQIGSGLACKTADNRQNLGKPDRRELHAISGERP